MIYKYLEEKDVSRFLDLVKKIRKDFLPRRIKEKKDLNAYFNND